MVLIASANTHQDRILYSSDHHPHVNIFPVRVFLRKPQRGTQRSHGVRLLPTNGIRAKPAYRCTTNLRSLKSWFVPALGLVGQYSVVDPKPDLATRPLAQRPLRRQQAQLYRLLSITEQTAEHHTGLLSALPKGMGEKVREHSVDRPYSEIHSSTRIYRWRIKSNLRPQASLSD
jgi:hypothetical protein